MKQLGGQGRIVITSSTSTQSFVEHTGAENSTYTHYLVEGIEIRIADLDNDGVISIEELHEYANRKVRKATPETLATGSYDETIKIWNLHTGELLRSLPGHLDWVNSAAISSDGQILASASEDKTTEFI